MQVKDAWDERREINRLKTLSDYRITDGAGVRNDEIRQLACMIALQCATDDKAKALEEKSTKAQVDGFIKEFREFRKEVDKEVSESNKTFEANYLKKKFNLVEKKESLVEPKKN